MMRRDEIARLRTQLREVNMEYSALVRTKGAEDRFVRLDELKAHRQTLMALIAKATHHGPHRNVASTAPDVVVQAA